MVAKSQTKKIGLVVRAHSPAAIALAKLVLERYGERVVLSQETAAELGRAQGVAEKELVRISDPIVTLGGDGTLIRLGRLCAVGSSPVMLGVNFGTLGFLTEIPPDALFPTLESVLSGNAEVGTRVILRARVFRGGESMFESQAVNEALVQKGSRDRLLDLDIRVDSEDVMRLRADGVIVATPTGSTAYSLAAGGAIVSPRLDAILLTPICPHSLTNRPLILPMSSVIEILVPPYDGEVFLSLDGQESVELYVGDCVRIERSECQVRFVRSPKESYFQILRTKLNWGIGNRTYST